MAELKTIVYEPFPHGRPKQYTQLGIVDLMMSRDLDHPRDTVGIEHGTSMLIRQAPAMAMAGTKPRPAPLPITGDVDAVLWEALTNGPVRIPTLATRIAKRDQHPNWRAFEAAKVKAMKLIGQMIQLGMVQRVKRKFVTAVPQGPKA